MLQKMKKPHFIGIGGIGMSAIAYVLKKMGLEVSGSDKMRNSVVDNLSALGVRIELGHQASNLPETCDAVVVSTAIKDSNVELLEAQRKNLPIYHRSDILAFLLNKKKGVAIAGAHGKTTTTSMLSTVVAKAGLDTSFLIGGEVKALGGNAHLGTGEWLIAEADESDGSFLKFFPYLSIITNIENDHMDYYKSMVEMERSFLRFANQTQPEGSVILCLDDEILSRLKESIKRKVITYGIKEVADYQAKNINYSTAGSSYDLFSEGKFVIRVELAVPGEHNILNSLAVLAAAKGMGLELPAAAEFLQDFTGAKRRFERKGENQGVLIVDDYAHHPSEIKSTLLAAKQLAKNRLVAVFQPHRYSRTQLLQKEFAQSFALADILILTDIYAAGEEPIAGVTGQNLVQEVKLLGRENVIYLPDIPAVAAYLENMVKQGDLVLTMGAGNIYQAGELLAQKLDTGAKE